MEENWDYIVMHEMDFYYKFPQFEQEIKDLLRENALDIQCPSMSFILEGMRCPGPEEQTIMRIEREQALIGILEHGRRRSNRIQQAIGKLDQDEAELLNIENETKQELKQARDKVIRKLHKLYAIERKEYSKQWNAMLREERRERIKDSNMCSGLN